MKSDLDTISLSIDSRDNRKLKFLIDTGAEISIIRSSSLTPGVNYQFHDGVNIKGICCIPSVMFEVRYAGGDRAAGS